MREFLACCRVRSLIHARMLANERCVSDASSTALLGRVAIHLKMIDPAQLQDAVKEQARRGNSTPLREVLLELGLLNPGQLKQLVAAQKQVVAKHRAKQAAEQALPEPEPAAVPASAGLDRPKLPANIFANPI